MCDPQKDPLPHGNILHRTQQHKSRVAIGGCYYTCSTLETTGYIYSTAVAAEETKAPVIDHCFLVRGENWLQQQEYIYQRIIDRYAGLAGCKKNRCASVRML